MFSLYDRKEIRVPGAELVGGGFTVRVTAPELNAVGVPGLDGGAFNQDFALYVVNAEEED